MVHQYKLNGYNIVLDTCSGSVHTVDEVAYDVIAMYKSHTAEEIVARILSDYSHLPDVTEDEVRECIEDVAALEAAGKLFSKDAYEGLARNYKNNSKVIKALCLHVAHTCNLNCSYCFASQGKYQGDRALMSFEVGKQAFDFLIANSGTRKNLEVDFFGGEPLMNWDVVKQLVAYARSIEKKYNKDENKQGANVVYQPKYIWAQTDTMIYAIYNTIDPIYENPYDYEPIEDEKEDDSLINRDPATFWMSFSTILLGVALVVALTMLIIKNIRRKRKASVSDAKSHYTVRSRVKKPSKTAQKPKNEQLDDSFEPIMEPIENEQTDSEQSLDDYVYGDVQDFGEDSKKEDSENE